MCGRFVVVLNWQDVVTFYDSDHRGENLPEPSYNLAPTDRVGIILESTKSEPPLRRLESARWGLTPTWAEDQSRAASMINARVETAAERPAFADAVVSRRAIIPANGYYEWQTTSAGKQPFYIHPGDDSVLGIAALYEWWRNPTEAADSPDRWMLSTTILTGPAGGELAEIHDRVPLLVTDEFRDLWLDPTEEGDEALLRELFATSAEPLSEMELRPVGAMVGSVRNNGPELIEEAAMPAASGLF